MEAKTITAAEKRAKIENLKITLGFLIILTSIIGFIVLGILNSMKGKEGLFMTIGGLCIFVFVYKFTETVHEEIKRLEKLKTVR
jgi:uncharacterized membrane protein YfcA